VIDAEGVSDIDTTAVQQLGELVEDLAAADVAVTFARVRGPVREMFERADIIELVGEDAIYLEVDDAVDHYLAGPEASGDDTEGDD
jgi:SulP family sulfate permease